MSYPPATWLKFFFVIFFWNFFWIFFPGPYFNKNARKNFFFRKKIRVILGKNRFFRAKIFFWNFFWNFFWIFFPEPYLEINAREKFIFRKKFRVIFRKKFFWVKKFGVEFMLNFFNVSWCWWPIGLSPRSTKMSPTSKHCHQHPEIFTNIMSPTSTCHQHARSR